MNPDGNLARRRQGGVTLMELLITVAIIGIIGAIAIPSYRQHMVRTHRSDATSALLGLAAAQEKFFLQNNRYTDSLTDLGYQADARSDNGVYTLAIVLRNGTTGFRATATPAAANPNGPVQTDDEKCTSFSIDETGARTATGDTPKICWG